MLRVLVCTVLMRTLYTVCFFLQFVAFLHAEPTSVWSYKGSVLALSQSESTVIITYQTLSDALTKSGAHAGDPLFRGQRTGNSLHGRVYRFFGAQCEPIGFIVDGTIEDNKIILHGVAPALGLNSCKIETTYYDAVLLTAVAAPGSSQQANLSLAEASAFKDNISLCRTGNKPACRAVLTSPLLTEERRAEIEAAAALPAASPSPVYLLFPFQCAVENGKPVFKPSSEPYYHEALNYRPPSSYAVCSPDKGGWVQSLFTTCQAVQLSSFRLVCVNGIIGAPALTAAGTSTIAKNAQIDSDAVRIPFYNRFRAADVPDGFHPLPQGWGLAPAALTVTSAATFDPIITHTRIPLVGNPAQTMPENFYVTLASWAPYPQLLIFPLFLCAAGLAGFGFWLEPDSSLAPRRALFWIWLVVALMGISEALVAANAVTDAFRDGQRTVAAAKDDEARLRALFVRHDGHVEPFRQRDMDLAKALQQSRTIPEVASAASAVPMRFFLSLLPAVLFLLVYARFIYAGYHYFFSRHPIEAAAGHELRTGSLFDLQKVGEALKTNQEHLFNRPPLHETLNKLRRGKAFREQTELDADLADAMMRRDRARKKQHEEETEIRTIKKKLPWWRRWW